MPKYLTYVTSILAILTAITFYPTQAVSGGCGEHTDHTHADVTPMVTSEWVYNKIESGETMSDVLLIDIRNSIGGGSYETYSEGHIPSSIHSDYGKDGWRGSSSILPYHKVKKLVNNQKKGAIAPLFFGC